MAQRVVIIENFLRRIVIRHCRCLSAHFEDKGFQSGAFKFRARYIVDFQPNRCVVYAANGEHRPVAIDPRPAEHFPYGDLAKGREEIVEKVEGSGFTHAEDGRP